MTPPFYRCARCAYDFTVTAGIVSRGRNLVRTPIIYCAPDPARHVGPVNRRRARRQGGGQQAGECEGVS